MIYLEHIYLKRDIDKAFLMGLESAIYILEKSVGLSPVGQRYTLESLKEEIEQGKLVFVLLVGCENNRHKIVVIFL